MQARLPRWPRRMKVGTTNLGWQSRRTSSLPPRHGAGSASPSFSAGRRASCCSASAKEIGGPQSARWASPPRGSAGSKRRCRSIGPFRRAPPAAACGRRWMSSFARSTSGELLIKKWNGSDWSPFAPVRAPEELDPMYPTLHGLVPLSSAPVAGGGGTSRLDVFARGPAGDLLHRWWNGETWTRFESLGMPGEPPVPLSGGALRPAAGEWRLDVLARAIDGKLYNVSPIFSPRHLLNSSH